MWKLWLVLSLLCVSAGFARGGRLPRSEDGGDVSDEDACTQDSDCDDGYACKDSKCAAEATEPPSKCPGGKCVGEKGLGETCNSTADCTTNSSLTCTSGLCQCPSDFVQLDGDCVKKAVTVGDACQADVQCEALNATCENGTCQASPKGVCGDENAVEVNGGGCECGEGFVESEDGRSCLKAAGKLGEECVETRQCEAANGTCVGGVCVEVMLSSVVVPAMSAPILISSECALDVDCGDIKEAVCKESICQCRESHIPSEDQSKCLPLARKAGDECEMDKQCSKVPNSSCLEGKCVGVAAAGVKARKSGGSSVIAGGSHAVVAALLLIGSRVFAG